MVPMMELKDFLSNLHHLIFIDFFGSEKLNSFTFQEKQQIFPTNELWTQHEMSQQNDLILLCTNLS